MERYSVTVSYPDYGRLLLRGILHERIHTWYYFRLSRLSTSEKIIARENWEKYLNQVMCQDDDFT